MSTSDKKLLKSLIFNTASCVWFAFFGAVYELFSHEVYSYYMIYAFAFLLLLGILPNAVCLMKSRFPGEGFLSLWNAAILTWTVGSVFKGVLDIYGTTNSLIAVYPAAGALLAASAFVSLSLYQRKLSEG